MLPALTPSPGLTLQPISLRAMNTDIELTLECEKGNIPGMEHHARTWFQYVEKRFSRFRPYSELTRINTLSGERTLISVSMLKVLLLATHYWQKTEGIFNPFILNALEEAGYNHSFEELSKPETPSKKNPSYNNLSVAHPSAVSAYSLNLALELDPGTHSLRIPAETGLDLGGIVKSWAVNHLVHEYQDEFQIARGFVNAGGDLSVWGGASEAGEPWIIGIENPWQPSQDIGTLALEDGSVATSSKLGRKWPMPNGIMHHLIDPRTLQPSTSDVDQCTVTGPDIIECEIWAKVLCILGLKKGLDLMSRQSHGYEAILFTSQKETHLYGKKASLKKIWHDIWIDHFHEVKH